MSRFDQMRKELSAVRPTPAVSQSTGDSVLHNVAFVTGALVPVVKDRSAKALATTKTFLGNVRTSYQYHEAVRKGEIQA